MIRKPLAPLTSLVVVSSLHTPPSWERLCVEHRHRRRVRDTKGQKPRDLPYVTLSSRRHSPLKSCELWFASIRNVSRLTESPPPWFGSGFAALCVWVRRGYPVTTVDGLLQCRACTAITEWHQALLCVFWGGGDSPLGRRPMRCVARARRCEFPCSRDTPAGTQSGPGIAMHGLRNLPTTRIDGGCGWVGGGGGGCLFF